jgi:hypothetical protein
MTVQELASMAHLWAQEARPQSTPTACDIWAAGTDSGLQGWSEGINNIEVF